ncbi:hypothetical protein M8C21_020596 [Ambrosia artemisiifolia]|uniref:MLO-like protein n=1 Tax=Ambrosia artemisiifolia TaxID=4212 RepID=A0AAD5GJJ0_AMBAR|nr:hypothetical protein M8C21_020596 [Ambrosia artemisiifolia]
MAGDTSEGTRQLDQTPTWAVAGVCALFIIVSIALEKIMCKVGKFLTDKHKKALFEALEKVKAELMILGFISLMLTFSPYYIAKICIPVDVADTMLPCAKRHKAEKEEEEEEKARRLLLWYEEHRRSLAGASKTICKKGKVPIITVDGLHQLHILVFFLAVIHVVYSVITMALGRLKARGWKQWEEETLSPDYEFTNDPSRFRLTHQTSFVRAHTSFWTRVPFFFYIGCFFRQFFRSVSKSDYMTLRNGFINLHLAPGTRFNFQKYLKRSLEDDFRVVVGVSPVLWASFVVFLLLNVNGWQTLFWASLLPLVIILAVGTKLQAILTKMALEITETYAVVQGIPLVQASDKYFWFSRPRLMLHLIHFALFQNAFQLTYFFWICYEYSINSCFHDNMRLVIIKLVLGVGVLILCSYTTLPLYALLSQMGSHLKKSIFDEQIAKALKKWRMAVKKKRGGKSLGRSTTSSVTASPVHSMASTIYPAAGATLHRFKTTGHSTRSFTYEDTDASDLEAEQLTPKDPSAHLLDVQVDYHSDNEIELAESSQQVETRNEDEFSFVKTAAPME